MAGVSRVSDVCLFHSGLRDDRKRLIRFCSERENERTRLAFD